MEGKEKRKKGYIKGRRAMRREIEKQRERHCSNLELTL